MSGRSTAPSALDRPAARIVALGIAALCALALVYIHRDDLFPPDAVDSASADPVALCFAERSAEIDRMATDGTVDNARAALFKSRAEALCQSTMDGGNSGPPLPRQ